MKFNYVPAYGFGKTKKCEIEKTDQLITPGPGSYKPIKLLKKNPIWKIGTAQRMKTETCIRPGPGSYNLRNKYPNGPSYSIAKKHKSFIKEIRTPGPADYSPSKNYKKESYSFGKKYKDKPKDISPGPGNYNLRTEKDLVVPSSIFGHEKKSVFDESTRSPGPANYKIDLTSTNIQHPIYSFAKDKKITNDNNGIPGPGSYKYKEYIGKEGKKISIGLKTKSKSMECIPGPGQYKKIDYDNILRKLPDIKIGMEKRFSTPYLFTENPGPGEYNDGEKIKNVKLKKPSWKIGTSLRKPLIDINDSPGPGNYNISKKIGDGAPHYSIRNKDNNKPMKTFITPGPGRYDSGKLNTYRKNPSWKIGTSKRNNNILERQMTECFPGPGTYKYYDYHLFTSPKYGFGTQQKYQNISNDYPGPGSYHIPCSIVEVNDYTRRQGVFDDKFKYI